MKAQLRIPTKEPYAYIEATVEGTPESILEVYNDFTALLKDPVALQGLSVKDWQTTLDRYLSENVMDSNAYKAMSAEQQKFCQELKRAFARLKAKE